jgi:hypothetical protein
MDVDFENCVIWLDDDIIWENDEQAEWGYPILRRTHISVEEYYEYSM